MHERHDLCTMRIPSLDKSSCSSKLSKIHFLENVEEILCTQNICGHEHALCILVSSSHDVIV